MNLTVKKIREENADVLSIIFDKPENFQFYSAQFIDTSVDIPNPDNSRIFSLSSSPTEDYLMITFKKGVSDYKKRLQNLRTGETVSITHPNGTYTLDESTPAVMIAGGVGIAPHRSMIKQAVEQKLDLPITLIYSNSDKDFPFRGELDKWQRVYPNLKIHYTETKKDGRLNKDKIKDLGLDMEAIYYLAGPPNLVRDFNLILQDLGIDRANIRLDSFDGY